MELDLDQSNPSIANLLFFSLLQNQINYILHRIQLARKPSFLNLLLDFAELLKCYFVKTLSLCSICPSSPCIF
jgi:hypothetical protein